MKDPWQMTAKEWRVERDAIRPQMGFSSKVTRRSASEAVARHARLAFLYDGVSEWLRAKMTDEDWGDDFSDLKWRWDHPRHKDIVEKALEEGRPVPKKVLKDYPDLHG